MSVYERLRISRACRASSEPTSRETATTFSPRNRIHPRYSEPDPCIRAPRVMKGSHDTEISPRMENLRFTRQMHHSNASRVGFSKFLIGQLDQG